ncbi:superfamily II DNA or RNA helicase [Chryseobacterium sediminis]|uniref:Superfamily II DNA or RNA helicase n=1 Tax=Chryseobacterium sediminis TaxID=1679494 RepID=A0ABR6PYQ4_9FLAO|nr:DEAD/DEAH box helicase [Chryseobacterium sediminis]MBB6330848.1 superfamily II DNA or RNA helicase [Chryseobacterium sediminis]
MKIIDKLTEDILRDEYFNALFNKCSLITAQNLFKKSNRVQFTTKELRDTLRFADILSNSKNSEARNRSYQIVASLNQDYKDNEVYRTVSKAIFSKLGNFPAINYLENKNKNIALLPIFREIETESKRLIQQAPDGNGMIFTDTQFELFNKLSKSTEFSFSGPTSMGKSFIIKSFIKKVIKNSPPENIIIIVPTRALINQFFSDLKNELHELLDTYKYKIFINSNVSDILTEEKYNYIFVLTPERLLSYLSQDTNPPIGFLFIDEAHKLANDKDARSVTTYSAIEKVQKKYGNVKLYFSSPNVSNPEIFLRLFNRDIQNSFRTGESPVSQNIYFVNLETKEVESYSNNSVLKLQDILDDSKDYSITKFIKFIGADKNNLIYCYSKRNTVNKAIELSKLLPRIEQSELVEQAIKNIKEYIHPEYYLVDFIEKGVAYHYGKLPQLIRNLIEDLYQKEEIRYVFCTSTLLEGVNMPTQNIFIIDNRSGSKTTLSPIDFWNLSGRAGRLTRELVGNIFCVQYEDFKWVDKDVLIRKDIKLQPTILTKIDHNLKKIEKALKNEEIKSGSEVEKEILKYIANIIKVDTLETTANYKSPIIDKLIEDNKQKLIDLAKQGIINFEIPKSILKFNQTINFEIQERIYKAVSKSKKSILPNSGAIKYESILKVLIDFHRLYSWDKTEKKLANVNSLKYYAVLMNQWVQGFSLSQIISQSIDYNHDNGYQVEVDFRVYEVFDKTNRRHINALIEKLIDDIEYVLRYILEKYFNHYYQILVAIIGESKAGDNWATLLEYGTQIPQVIALQNIGLSRNTAIKIFRHHRKSLILKDNKLVGVNKALLLNEFRSTSLEFEEIKRTL